ncbi:MerR family DNA-binding transcriptional regulator [Cuspidothrix issatschenkoi]|uniref:MerR family DNA-binding transcriptional regulator n=1 Tax=Cuspidothrix issatschenkoi TaxID=230752 RepID=UPI001D14054E|nr:MerR family DNA-binding transcriptional regulator [Cuspidothrix issatschenkoi]
MAYIPLRKAVEFLGLHPNTLRRYADEGKIKSIKNPAGQRLYDVESYIRGDSIRTPTICYCRNNSPLQVWLTPRRAIRMKNIFLLSSLFPVSLILRLYL